MAEICLEMPFASRAAHSAAAMRSEASLDADASALFGGLPERSRLGDAFEKWDLYDYYTLKLMGLRKIVGCNTISGACHPERRQERRISFSLV